MKARVIWSCERAGGISYFLPLGVGRMISLEDGVASPFSLKRGRGLVKEDAQIYIMRSNLVIGYQMEHVHVRWRMNGFLESESWRI